MKISVQNIVFVADTPKPGKDRLVAVFAVKFWDSLDLYLPDYSITVNDFRYYQSENGDGGYITVPSIKTKHGIVRPVAIDQPMRKVIYDAFILAWENLPKAPAE